MADSTGPAEEPLLPPWRLMTGALAALVLAIVLRLAPTELLTLPRVLLIVGGLLAAGSAIWIEPRNPRLILSAAGLAMLASWGMDSTWDSAIMLTAVLMWLALLAAFLVGLPWLMGWVWMFKNHVSARPGDPDAAFQDGRQAGHVAAKALFSLLILLHFGGIATAILSTSSGGTNPAWLAQNSWMAYRHYLTFAYLTNAYKFYSPEPGPADLLWIRIEYADGSARWVKLPNRQEHAPDPLAQEYTRRLTLARSIGDAYDRIGGTPADLQRRQSTLVIHGIPIHPYVPINIQYAVPSESARRLMKEYVRHVARSYPSETNPALPITGIKVYRVTHMMLDANQMARPYNLPEDRWTQRPYYQGEYTADGVLKDPDDPLLYWLIPIFRTAPGQRANLLGAGSLETVEEPDFGDNFDIWDYLEIHAKLPTAQRGPKQ